MPHITEDTVTRLHDRITPGARITRRFWKDDSAPMISDALTADTVEWHPDGALTVTYSWYTEGSRYPKTSTAPFGPQEPVALIEDGEPYRLLLPGGRMDARPGGNLRSWDAYLTDGTPLAQDVTTAQARALLADHAPEMIWVDNGGGNYSARGHGHHWRIRRGRRNPDYDALRTPVYLAWLFDLQSRPQDSQDPQDWHDVKHDCPTPADAQAAADTRP